jgi:hypothetical protein
MWRAVAKPPEPFPPKEAALPMREPAGRGRAAPAFALGLALALAAWPACAIDWSFKAFGTLAGVGTDTDKLGFRRDLTQESSATRAWVGDIDSRLGLQLDVDINSDFHAMAQWVARNHEGDYFWQNLDWAFIGWHPRDDLNLRVGRLGFDAFLLSEYRNVGYAYLWMRPPVEFYGLVSFYNFDGGDIVKKFDLDEGRLTLKGYAGHSFQATAFNIDVNALIFGFKTVYESGNWLFSLGYMQEKQLDNGLIKSLGQYNNPVGALVWPGIVPLAREWASVDKLLHYTTFGVSYDDGKWPVQAELNYIDSNLLEFPNVLAGYLSVGRRVGKVTPFVLLGVAESLNHTTFVPAPLVKTSRMAGQRAFYDGILNFKGVDQISASLGARWDVHENVALKAQWSHFWLGGDGTLLWPKYDGLNEPANVNVWSFGVDFVY